MPPKKIKHQDITKLLAPSPEKGQSMRGFEEQYSDIVDYIVRCTHAIWEEKGVGLIYTHYLHNCIVHGADGITYGRDQVVADTLSTLAAFPDRKLYADAVVWTGDDEAGFFTSHLITNVAHNTGYSVYGPPTGRKVVWRGIALCLVKENRICEEWLLRDDIEVIRQLGLDLKETVASLALRDAQNPRPPQPHGEIERGIGQLPPEVLPPKETPEFDVEDLIRRSTHEIWNWRLLNKVREYYAEGYIGHLCSGRELYGQQEYVAFVLSLLAAFPDARFFVDQLFWNEEEDGSIRTSLRWSLPGTHLGHGIYGPPTGARIHIWGLTQHIIRDGKIAEEWTYFNELHVLKQIFLARHQPATASPDPAE
jgi:predicted ester cyclase